MSLLGIVAYWAAIATFAVFLVRMVASAVRRERRHKQQVRADELRRALSGATHWRGVKNVLPGSARDAGDMPSSWDPHITEKPRNPQRGEES